MVLSANSLRRMKIDETMVQMIEMQDVAVSFRHELKKMPVLDGTQQELMDKLAGSITQMSDDVEALRYRMEQFRERGVI